MGLLNRQQSAADHRHEALAQLRELPGALAVLDDLGEPRAFDHEAVLGRRAALHCGLPLLQELAHRSRAGAAVEHFVVAGNEAAALADLDGGLQFVASEHPDAHVGPLEVAQGLGHSVLQLVEEGGGAEQREVSLEALGVLVEEPLSVGERSLGQRLFELAVLLP